MNMKKVLAGILAVAMLAASATVSFAKAPSQYDGQSYESLGIKSDDPDGEVNLAVIANGDVRIYGDTMYIEGSVYSNGTIYAGNGQGNKIDGMFISGTGNTTFGSDSNNDEWTQYRTAEGFVHVDDNGSTDGINYYSTQVEHEGGILDTDTSFECSYDAFEIPQIANEMKIDNWSGVDVEMNVYGNDATQWGGTQDTTAKTITEDTKIGTLLMNGSWGPAMTIDTTAGDVTVVIDEIVTGSANINIKVVGDNDAYIYIGALPENVPVIINNDNTVFPMNVDGSVDKTHLYLTGENVVLGAARINVADMYVNASSLTIDGATLFYGDIYSGAEKFVINGGQTEVYGTVCVPNAAAEVDNSGTLYGQLHTDTLTINGAGRIIWQKDSMLVDAEPTATPATTATPSATTTPDTGDTTIAVNPITYVVISEVNGKTCTFDVAYSTPSDDKSFTVTMASNSGTNCENFKYVTLVNGSNSNWGQNADTTGVSGTESEVTVTFPDWFMGYNIEPGTIADVIVTANDGSGATAATKIIFVDAMPTETPAPTAVPEVTPVPVQPVVPDSGSAYIFGYEPEITYTDVYDEEGNLITTDANSDIYMAPMDNVTREQVAAMITRMLDQLKGSKPAYKLTDNIAQYDGTWYVRGLACLNSKGAFGDEIYLGPITRGEVAKLIVKGFDLEGAATVPYADVAGNPYYDYISTMYYYGLMTGISDEAFEPDRIMTRAEFCKLFNNIIGRDAMSLTTAEGITITPATYSIVDIDKNAWYYETVLKATSSYDDEGNVDIQKRQDNIRNKLDDYDSQLLY